MPPVRLGAIGFVNTLPLTLPFVWPSGLGDGHTIEGSPAQLNQALLSGSLDISPISSACYLRCRDQLVLLPDLSVSSPGAVESVLFVSRQPPDTPDALPATIPVPDDSETSIALLCHMLHTQTGIDPAPRLRPYPAACYESALNDHGCALIIGDRALFVGQTAWARAPWHVSDLSRWWAQRHGLPFVFAVWAARRDFAHRQPNVCQAVSRALHQARDAFFSDTNLFERGVLLAARRSGVRPDRLRHYYRHALTYHLTPAHQRSLDMFAGLTDSRITTVSPTGLNAPSVAAC